MYRERYNFLAINVNRHWVSISVILAQLNDYIIWTNPCRPLERIYDIYAISDLGNGSKNKYISGLWK